MSTPSYIPDIKANPHAWFHYYDRNRCGTLDKSEVITGLDETFPAIDTNTVRQIVNFLWPGILVNEHYIDERKINHAY